MKSANIYKIILIILILIMCISPLEVFCITAQKSTGIAASETRQGGGTSTEAVAAQTQSSQAVDSLEDTSDAQEESVKVVKAGTLGKQEIISDKLILKKESEDNFNRAAAYNNSCEKKIIEQIEALNVESDGRTIKVNVEGYGITLSNYVSIMNEIFWGNPQIFYVSKSYRLLCGSDMKEVKQIWISLNMSKSEVIAKQNSVKAEMNKIAECVDTFNMTDQEIALAVHDYLAATVKYDNTFSGSNIYNMYGALVEHKAVCQGYASAYQYIMNLYGIPTGLVTSSNAAHAWNAVRIGGKWYHVDVTWDDPIGSGSGTSEPGYTDHNYFLVSTNTLLNIKASDAKRSDYKVRGLREYTYNNATSTNFQSGFWNDSLSAAWYYNGYWYYSDRKSFRIVKYNYGKKTKSYIVTDSSVKWPVYGKSRTYYAYSYSYLARTGKYLYYTTPTKVYRYNMSTKSKSLQATCRASTGKIFGLGISGTAPYYVVKKAPHKSALSTVKISSSPYPKTVFLSTTKYTYNGKVKKPSVTVRDNNGNNVSTSKYDVYYPSGRKYVGKYTVTVKFAPGYYNGRTSRAFTICPGKTSIVSLRAGAKSFTVKWSKKTTQTTGYQIQYSRSSKFTGKTTKLLTVSRNTATSKRITKLSSKKRYYVRVRTYAKIKSGSRKGTYYSGWSKYKSVTVK